MKMTLTQWVDYDGQPCNRDCADRCPDPEKSLMTCDLQKPADGLSLSEFCQNDCIQGTISHGP
jgi:hypothetical protein